MELNDESTETVTPGKDSVTEPEVVEEHGKADEGEIEAEVEAEIEADVEAYEADVEAEVVVDKARVEEEEGPRDDAPPYVPVGEGDNEGQSLLRRLSPYLTVAGLLLIGRIVVYSLRRRRR